MTSASSRYEIGREIRRDGDTVLVEGFDVRLARDVALRLPVGEVDAEAVRRFVTEARVGARLQHPGVVPVYELGVGSDGRPFCAGPRVRGRTLTEVLAARPVDGAARHRFLVAVERVSLTLAYVHAEGIAHGRLSGDAVWVGDHGEVRLTDWGHARHGAGYEDDLRALGDLLARAAGDDPGAAALRDVARRCQAPDLSGDAVRAQDVAAAVSAHLAAAKERAHRHEIEALTARGEADWARARADERAAEGAAHRRRRRQTLLLVGASLLAVAVGVTGWRAIAQTRRAREDRARDAVEVALRDAERLQGGGDLAAAAAAAARGAALADEGLTGSALATRASQVAATLAGRARAEREAAERVRGEQAAARAAEEARIARALDPWEGAPPARADVERASWDRPGDLWRHLEAARHALHVEPKDPRLVARHLTAALALRPSSEALRAHLARP